jgi:hypothetical protein
MMVETPIRVTACPYCGSTNLVISAYSLVCRSCGTVVEELLLYYGPSSAAEEGPLRRKERWDDRHTSLLGQQLRGVTEKIYEGLQLRLSISRAKAYSVAQFVNSNECVRTALLRLRDENLIPPLALFLYDYVVEGSYDLPSLRVGDRKIRRRLVATARRIIEQCGLAVER